MQSCRSLQSLTISANVSKIVQQRLIFGRKFNKLTEEKQQELISSQINILQKSIWQSLNTMSREVTA